MYLKSIRKFNIIDAAVGLLSAVVLESLTTVVWIQVTHTKVSSINGPLSLGQEVSGFIGLWIGFIGAPYVESKLRGSKIFTNDVGLKINWRTDVILGLILGVASQFVFVNLLYLPFEIMSKSLKHTLSVPAHNLTASGTSGGFYTEIFLVAIVAPIAEEIFFRGFLLRALMDTLNGRTKYSVLVSIFACGITFGLAHGELLQLPALALFGILLAYVAYRTNRIGITIFAHIGFNSVAAVMLISSR